MDPINEAYEQTVNEGFVSLSKHPQARWMYPVMSHRGAMWMDVDMKDGTSAEVVYAPDGGQGDGKNVIVVVELPADKNKEALYYSLYDVKDLKGTAKKIATALSSQKTAAGVAKKFNMISEN